MEVADFCALKEFGTLFCFYRARNKLHFPWGDPTHFQLNLYTPEYYIASSQEEWLPFVEAEVPHPPPPVRMDCNENAVNPRGKRGGGVGTSRPYLPIPVEEKTTFLPMSMIPMIVIQENPTENIVNGSRAIECEVA